MIKQARKLKAIKHRRKPSDGTPPSGLLEEVEEKEGSQTEEKATDKKRPPRNQGTLLLDATVAPLHIAYPTDSRLLSHAREHTERLISQRAN